MKDRYGNVVTTDRPETVEAMSTFHEAFLSMSNTAAQLVDVAREDPDCPLVNAHAAALMLSVESAQSMRDARPFLANAKAHKRRASDGEQAFIDAVDAWARGRMDEAMARHEEISERWPTQLVAAKWGQTHYFNIGDAEGMRRLGERSVAAAPEVPYAWGLYAFGLEEDNRLEEAEEAGRRAIAMQRVEPWAHHAVAHVLETQGRVDEGIAFLTELSDTWSDRAIFIYDHNWWHLALFHLDADAPEEALAVYDNHLFHMWPEFGQEQVGAISMLWRLEMRGVDVGDRWGPVVAAVRAREHEHIQPFLDIQYAYALARAGRDAEAEHFIASMDSRGGEVVPLIAWRWRDVAAPAARGFVAYAQGRHEAAYRALAPVIGRLREIGGSHAQRDVFIQGYLDILRRTGRSTELLQRLHERHRARPHVAVTQRLIEEVEAQETGPAASAF